MTDPKQLTEFYLKQAEQSWKIFTEPSYRNLHRLRTEPLSLKFWASESIKKQQFVVARVEKTQFYWTHQHPGVSLWHLLSWTKSDLTKIVNKCQEEVFKEALTLVKNSPHIKHWKN